jgi:hypothetical protein
MYTAVRIVAANWQIYHRHEIAHQLDRTEIKPGNARLHKLLGEINFYLSRPSIMIRIFGL